MDRKEEVLGILAEGEFHDLLVHADSLPGLGEALQGVLDRYMLTWSMWKCLASAEHPK